MERELTRNTYKSTMISLIRFALPLIGSGVLQQLYAWADAFIVGNVEGEIALASVGSTTSLVNFFTTLITGFTIGLSILFAERYGEKKEKEISKILATFTLILTALFTFISIFAIKYSYEMLSLMSTTEEAISGANEYLSVVLIGLPFLALYNVFSAALRGIGDSRTPFLAVLVSASTNVVLDIVFVAVFSMGVWGAAVATLISQVAMTVFIVLYALIKRPILRFKLSISKKAIKDGMLYGTPTMIQNSLNAVGSLILQDFMNSFGTETVIAITTAYRVDSLVLLPVLNLSSGIATMTAQEKGRGNDKGIVLVKSAGLILMAITSLLLTAIVVPSGGFLISLFGAGESAVDIGSRFFVRIASFYIIFGLALAYRGHIEGKGDLLVSSILALSSLVIRIGLSYLWRDALGNMVIAWAEAVAWCAMLLMYIVRSRMLDKARRGYFKELR